MKKHYKQINMDDLAPGVNSIIEEILRREGGAFTDYLNDHPTKWGIRKLSADRAGYEGRIEELTKQDAARIWTSLFWYGPNLHLIGNESMLIAETVLDTAGPAGLRVGITHLQEALTSFNRLYNDSYVFGPDLLRDGIVGKKTAKQLRMYLKHRANHDGLRKLATRLNCLQDAHYTKIAIRNPGKRDFSFGWTSQRVFNDLVQLARMTDEMETRSV